MHIVFALFPLFICRDHAEEAEQFKIRLVGILKAIYSLGEKLQALNSSGWGGKYYAADEKTKREPFIAGITLRVPADSDFKMLMEAALSFIVAVQQPPDSEIFQQSPKDNVSLKEGWEEHVPAENLKSIFAAGAKLLGYFLKVTVDASLETADLAK